MIMVFLETWLPVILSRDRVMPFWLHIKHLDLCSGIILNDLHLLTAISELIKVLYNIGIAIGVAKDVYSILNVLIGMD
jgi:hypothetical protein